MQNVQRILAGAVLGLTMGVALTGCADFDRQDRIEDTRILAIRTEPAEIKFSPLYSLLSAEQRLQFPIPAPGNIDVEVFAFDPRGGDLSYTMQLCPPDANDSSCLQDFDPHERLENTESPRRDSLEAVYFPSEREATLSGDDVKQAPEGQVPNADYAFNFDTAVMDDLIAGQLSLFSINPRFVFQVENTSVVDPDGASRERGFKRIPMSLDLADPSFPPDFKVALLAAFGTELCEGNLDGDDFEEGTTDCLAALPANENPNLVGFNLFGEPLKSGVAFGDTADVSKSGIISASRGSEVSLEPIFAEGTVQRYQVFSFDIEGGDLTVVNRNEDLSLAWFTTDGDISVAQGSVQFGENLAATWVLPSVEARDAGEIVSLVLVVRDQRGGVDFARVRVELR